MECKNLIHLSRKSNWSRARQISVIRSDSKRGLDLFTRAASQECGAKGSPVAIGLLFEPEGSPVAFSVDRESVLNGGSGLHVLSSGALASFPLWEELVTCVRAAIRHSNTTPNGKVVCFGDVRANFTSMEVTRLGERVILTAQELKTLKFLVMNPGRLISREELLNKAWGYDNYPSTRTVDNHILKLRRKLESDPTDPVHFLTVHGVGYRFVP